jgi:hypothetical protein
VKADKIRQQQILEKIEVAHQQKEAWLLLWDTETVKIANQK